MKRLTVHLENVKPILVTSRKWNKEADKYDYTKKKKTFNTVTFEAMSEDECLSQLNFYMEEKKNKRVKVKKKYFSNIR